MSAIDELLERARQKLTGDSVYIGEFPYALELISPEELFGSSLFVFPLGPQSLSLARVFRQSVTPTLGGLVAEERGNLWYELQISGNFGLAPKSGQDTSFNMDAGGVPGLGPLGGTVKLSGPLWTRRMLKNIFDRYGDLKADPATSADTQLVWHNFKDEEHFLIVPERVELSRSVGSRMMYPFNIRAKVVGLAETTVIFGDLLSGLAKILAGLNSAIDTVRTALAIVQAVFQEGSQILGEVRYQAARIDAVIGDVGTIVASMTDFVDGVVQTASIGSTFISSVAADLEAVIALIDAVDSIVPDVAANYRRAVDGLDSMAAALKATEQGSHGASASTQKASGKGLNGLSEAEVASAEAAGPPGSSYDMASRAVPSTVRMLRDGGAVLGERAFTTYSGFTAYTIQRGDTLAALAARLMGAASLWYDIAMANGLRAPYVSPAGGPGVARPGDVLAIPNVAPRARTGVQRSDPNPERLYGRDMKLEETAQSAPGRPAVDLAINRATNRGVATIGGIPNLVQSVQLRTWTERGTVPLVPTYGLPRVVGLGLFGATETALRLALRGTLLSDSRIERITSMQATITGDRIDFDVQAVPVGAAEPFSLETALV